MSVTGVTGTATATASAFSKTLGKDDFIKLLLTELRYQDATNPMDDKDMIAQMAQFSSLEQTQNLNASIERLAVQMGLNTILSGVNLLGREITYDRGDGESTGIVTALKQLNGSYQLMVGDTDVLFSEIIEIG